MSADDKLFDDFLLQCQIERGLTDPLARAETLLQFLEKRDPKGEHTRFCVEELRRILAPESRIAEADYTVEEEVLRRLQRRLEAEDWLKRQT